MRAQEVVLPRAVRLGRAVLDEHGHDGLITTAPLDVFAWAAVAGFTFSKLETRTNLRPELQGQPKFTGLVARGKLNPKVPYREICHVAFSCMPTGQEIRTMIEDPVVYTLYRNDRSVKQVMMNPRASYQCSMLPGNEITIGKTDTLRLDVEPCWTTTVIELTSQTNDTRPTREDPFPATNAIVETFKFVDGVCVSSDIAPLSYKFKIPAEWRA